MVYGIVLPTSSVFFLVLSPYLLEKKRWLLSHCTSGLHRNPTRPKGTSAIGLSQCCCPTVFRAVRTYFAWMWAIKSTLLVVTYLYILTSDPTNLWCFFGFTMFLQCFYIMFASDMLNAAHSPPGLSPS